MFEILSNGKMRIVRGDTGEFNVEIFNRDGSLYELQEGDEVVFTVKNKAMEGVDLIRKLGPYIRINPADTSRLSFGKYQYDVQVQFADGTVDTIIPKNIFEVMEEVTW